VLIAVLVLLAMLARVVLPVPFDSLVVVSRVALVASTVGLAAHGGFCGLLGLDGRI